MFPCRELPVFGDLSFDVIAGALAVAAIVLVQGAGVSDAVAEPRRLTIGREPRLHRAGCGQPGVRAVPGAARRRFRRADGVELERRCHDSLGGDLSPASGCSSSWSRSPAPSARRDVLPRRRLDRCGDPVDPASTDHRGVAIGHELADRRHEYLPGHAVRPDRRGGGDSGSPCRCCCSSIRGSLTCVSSNSADATTAPSRRSRRPLAPHDRAVTVLDAYGSLLYAGARTLQIKLPDPAGAEMPVVVLRLRGHMSLGATFAAVLADYVERLDRVGGHLILSGVQSPTLGQDRAQLERSRSAGSIDIFEATRRRSASRRSRRSRPPTGGSPNTAHVTDHDTPPNTSRPTSRSRDATKASPPTNRRV